MRIGRSAFTNMKLSSSSTSLNSSPPSQSPAYIHRSAWHSPVPYLFGGLAAMLGLIAFALIILACSYWKLSGYMDAENDGQESENNSNELQNTEENRVFEEKFLVIMAGELKPTHIATPSTSRTSSFGSDKAALATAKAGEGGEVHIRVRPDGSRDPDGTSTTEPNC